MAERAVEAGDGAVPKFDTSNALLQGPKSPGATASPHGAFR